MEKSFAKRLSKAMELRNITQAELVEKTGITKGAISQYLKGEYEPKLLNLTRIADALNVNKAWLEGKSDTIEKFYGLQEGGGRIPKENVLLLRSFSKLNAIGKQEAIKRVEELTYIDRYVDNDKLPEIYEHKNYFGKVAEKPKNYPELNAAHEIEDATDGDKLHDDNVMDDDNF